MPAKITIQEYADIMVHEKYRQPVMTIADACKKIEWDLVDRPVCCGKEVELYCFLGSCYNAVCKTCGKFVADVTGPTFGSGSVTITDPDKVDFETDYEKRWIAGVEATA